LKRRWLLVSAALSIATVLIWASSRSWRAPSDPGSPSIPAPPPSSIPAPALALPEVLTVHEQEASAYHARLFAEEEDVVLVTPAGFTTIRPGQSAREHHVALGPVVARQGEALVFWRSGSLRELSLADGGERKLAALPRPPRYLLASGGRLACIDGDRERTSLQTLSGGDIRLVHETAHGITAAAMRAADVYWVAQGRDDAWRIERIDLDGKHQLSSPAHHGRVPAMLAVGNDGVYFYDGPQRGVRRLTFDLERESSVLPGVVCSPVVVSNHVVCAQVGGLYDVPPSGAAPRFLASERAGPITALALTPSRAFWVAENGAEKLLVRSVTIGGP